eukprot:m.116211 g.116211  ORF g.116211 m.116211 type:complete len:448 (-) comp16374_c0_seq2:1151-2494(-)
MAKVKKKKGSGKKKSGKKKSAKSKTVSASDVPKLTKEFYLIQIADLELRLQKANGRCQEAVDRYKALLQESTQQRLDTGAVVEYHKREQGRARDGIAELAEAKQLAEEAAAQRIADLEAEVTQAKAAHEADVDALRRDLRIRDKKLEDLAEFQANRAEVLAQVDDLTLQLQQQQAAHDQFVIDTERKSVEFQNRVKQDMVAQLEELAAAYRTESEAQLANATKMALVENETLGKQLASMSKNTDTLLGRTKTMQQLDQQYRVQIDLLESNEVELTQQIVRQKEVIARLRESNQALMADLSQERELAAAQHEQHSLTLTQKDVSLAEDTRRLRAKLAEREAHIRDLKVALEEANLSVAAEQGRVKDLTELVTQSLATARKQQQRYHHATHLFRCLFFVLGEGYLDLALSVTFSTLTHTLSYTPVAGASVLFSLHHQHSLCWCVTGAND